MFAFMQGPKKRKRVVHESVSSKPLVCMQLTSFCLSLFVQDLIDRGLGYDQTDSFVDDSEVVRHLVQFLIWAFYFLAENRHRLIDFLKI